MPRAPGWNNEETSRAIIRVIENGGSRVDAARQANVSFATLEGWYDRIEDCRARLDAAEQYARSSGRGAPKAVVEKDGSDRWARIKAEAAILAPGMFGILLWVDALLVSKGGFSPLSPYWRELIRRFWESEKRWLIDRAGRGAGKSKSLCLVAVVECLFGDHSWLGPGETALWPIMSTDMDEANSKVPVIQAILDTLGVSYEKQTRTMGRTRIVFQDITGKSIEIRVFPASVEAASGPTLAGCTNDEEAKWKANRDKGYSGAEEVLDALGPAFRTRKGTHGYRSSSAWTETGPHYHDIQDGDTDIHFIARLWQFCEQARTDLLSVAAYEKNEAERKTLEEYARNITPESPNIPTWIANPSITAIDTRREARNFDAWMREYVSRSSGSAEETFFDAIKLSEALMVPRPQGDPDRCFAAIDPGSTSNAFALAVVGRWGAKPPYRFAPVHLREWIPVPGAPLDVDREVLPDAASDVLLYGCREWRTDAHYGPSAQLRGAEHGLTTRFSSPDIFETEYEPARRALHRGEVSLAGAPELRRQLALARARFGDGGKRKIVIAEERGKEGLVVHGDLGRAFVRALAAAGAGAIQVADTSALTSIPGRYRGADPRRR